MVISHGHGNWLFYSSLCLFQQIIAPLAELCLTLGIEHSEHCLLLLFSQVDCVLLVTTSILDAVVELGLCESVDPDIEGEVFIVSIEIVLLILLESQSSFV